MSPGEREREREGQRASFDRGVAGGEREREREGGGRGGGGDPVFDHGIDESTREGEREGERGLLSPHVSLERGVRGAVSQVRERVRETWGRDLL